MQDEMKIVALVPMRHQSVRVPGKNYRDLAGKPLFHHILISLMECTEFSNIVVDTDSPTIMQGIRENFPTVEILERPQHLRSDMTPTNEILLHDVLQFPADLYLQTHATNPLLKPATISRAIKKLKVNYPEYDSLFSATRLQTRLWDELVRPINHNSAILLRTQDLPPVFEENSCMYIFSRQTLEMRRNRLGERPFLFEIDRAEAWDIDEELDFLIADLLMSQMNGGS
jgi:CMP-N-acetylneuraminic acid synthetase